MNRHREVIVALRRPSAAESAAASACVVLLVVGVVAASPFASAPMNGLAPLLPAYATAVLAFDVLAAALLLSQYIAIGSPALLALVATYLFNGLTAIAWVASFPGVLAPEGWLGGDLQTTAVIAAFRRLAFPFGVFVYAALRRVGADADAWRPSSSLVATAVVAASILGAALATWVGVGMSASSPTFMSSPLVASAVWDSVLWASIALTALAALAIVWLRPFSVLDMWLLVTLTAGLIEIVLLGFVADGVRFSLGWWIGRALGLAAVAVVALALLMETVAMTARSVTTLMAEVQARRARESTLEALGAAIAHELNQPLAAIVTGAQAAGRWLDRPEPDLASARQRLAAISDDGARAGRVLAGLRQSFGRRSPLDAPVSVRALLSSVAALVREDAAKAGVRVVVHAGGTGEIVLRGDADQFRQVLLNLVANAIQAMVSTASAARVVTLAACADASSVVLTVGDTGPGLPADLIGSAFEPFLSGKPEGMGLGLMISRTLVEAHGGSIAASNLPNGGAMFEITLPRQASRV